MVSIFAAWPSCPRFDSQHSQKNFIGEIYNVAEFNQLPQLEENGQGLENVD